MVMGSASELSDAKVADPTSGAFPSRYTGDRLVQPANAVSSMLRTLAGIVTVVRLLQAENAAHPILITLLPNEMLVNDEESWNARSPIFVTLFGMATFARLDP